MAQYRSDTIRYSLPISMIASAALCPEVLDEILCCLQDSNGRVREDICGILWRSGGRAARPDIVDRLLELIDSTFCALSALELLLCPDDRVLRRLVQELDAARERGDSNLQERLFGGLVYRGHQRSLDMVVEGLRSPNHAERLSAVKMIAYAQTCQDDVLAELSSCLQDNSQEIRASACKALCSIGPAASAAARVDIISLLLDALQDNDNRVRAGAAFALENMGLEARSPEVIDGLRALLQDEESEVRSSAIRALAKLQPGDLLDHLLPLLRDPDQTVRSSILCHLPFLGVAARRNEVIDELLLMLPDPQTAWTLGGMGTAAARPDVLSRLREFECVNALFLLAMRTGGAMGELVDLLVQDEERTETCSSWVLGALPHNGFRLFHAGSKWTTATVEELARTSRAS